MEEKECPYCAGYREEPSEHVLNKMERTRLCGAVHKMECIEEEFTHCAVFKAVKKNETLNTELSYLKKCCDNLACVNTELSRRNKELTALMELDRGIRHYLGICKICEHSVPCNDCVNKNAVEFCQKLARILEE